MLYRAGNGSSAPTPRSDGMLRFYTEDSPGLAIGPATVVIMSTLFIATVMVLHFWAKLTGS